MSVNVHCGTDISVSEKFLPYIDIKTPIVAAKLHNEAGIIGAAYYASIKQK